jgi:3-oxoacyl-[acyl-carrier protein] reductase/bacilysin biosynthesis oxidoreductase BacG
VELNLKGKRAIVTGGSEGIGLACAEALFCEGVSVVIVGIDKLDHAANAIRKLADKSRADEVIPITCDLSRGESIKLVVETAMKRFGRIDILINCAGAARAGDFFDLTDDDYISAWTLKCLGYIRMVREAARMMICNRDGRIVNIIGAGGRMPSATFLPGSTVNAALINFTRGVSKELAQYNIRINAISPAPVSTERANRLAEQTAQARGMNVDEVKAETARNIPLGRLIYPTEVANMVLFLVSDLSASMTGTEVLVDGGQTACI